MLHKVDSLKKRENGNVTEIVSVMERRIGPLTEVANLMEGD